MVSLRKVGKRHDFSLLLEKVKIQKKIICMFYFILFIFLINIDVYISKNNQFSDSSFPYSLLSSYSGFFSSLMRYLAGYENSSLLCAEWKSNPDDEDSIS